MTFEPNTPWRKVATAIYRKPLDAKILGTVELDVTDLETWIIAKRQEGLKVSMMYPFVLWVSRALKHEVPELNCYVSGGNVRHHERVDAMVTVLMRGEKALTMLKVPDADQMSLPQLVAWLQDEIPRHRRAEGDSSSKMIDFLAKVPWPFRRWLVDTMRKIVIEWGVALPGITRPENYGSFLLSNIGSVGLDIGYPSLMPASNIPMVLIMGSVQTKPAVHEGQIVPRRMLNLSVSLDHRVVDALHGGKLFRYLKAQLKHPENLM